MLIAFTTLFNVALGGPPPGQTGLVGISGPDPTLGQVSAPECPEEGVVDCDDLEPMSPADCVNFFTARTYSRDENGDCILTDISQTNATVGHASTEEDCETGNPPQVWDVPGDTDGCKDTITVVTEWVTPGDFCCGTCTVFTFPKTARQLTSGPNAGEWACLPEDADPSTPKLDAVTRDDFCFPGSCTPSYGVPPGGLETLPTGAVIVDESFLKKTFNLWWGFLEQFAE